MIDYQKHPDPKAQMELALSGKTTASPKLHRPRFNFNRDNTKYGKRHKKGVMNGTEKAYAAILEEQKAAGEIIDWIFEAVTFRLTDGLCTYTPDFQVFYADGVMEFVDAKGGGPIDDKSIVKVKCAAEKFWMYRFVVMQKLSKKHIEKNDGKPWKRTEY